MAKTYVKAAYDYAASEVGELSFKEGDVITVTAQHASGWWTGELKGTKGTFPSNFTEPCAPPVVAKPVRASYAPPSGGASNPMAELQAKLARRKEPSPSNPAPVAAAPTTTAPLSKGPSRSSNVTRMAQSMAPKSNKPPPPSRADRKKIETGGATSVSSARQSILAKGIGLPGTSNVSPFGASLKKPPAAAAPLNNNLMKSAPIRSPRSVPSPRNTTSTAPVSNTTPVVRPSITPRAQPPVRAQPPAAPAPAIPSEPSPTEQPPMAKAAYDYEGTGAGSELLFKEGQEIVILQKDDSGWWEGELDGLTGWFPAEFVKEIENTQEPQGPTVADKLSEVVSTEKRLATPKKAVRKGRRPPTRGKRSAHAVKSARTETNDPPKDMSAEETQTRPRGMSHSANIPMGNPLGFGGPTRSITPTKAGLRKTVAPASKPSTDAPSKVDFRANLRSTIAPGSVSISKSTPPDFPSEPAPATLPTAATKTSPFGTRLQKPRDKTPPAPIEEPKKSSPFGPRVGGPKKVSTPAPAPAPVVSEAPKPSPFGARVTPKPKDTTPPTTSKPKVAQASPRAPIPANSTSGGSFNVSPSLPSALGDYNSFCAFVERTFDKLKGERINGATSISPQLNRADSSHFSFSMCTVDGVRYSYGDQRSFSLQEAAFPFLYAISYSEMSSGVDNLVSNVPYTASNPMTLHSQKAQNPLCPAGAIAMCSSLYETQDIIDRSYEITQKLSALAGSGVGSDVANIFAAKKYNYSDKALTYWLQSNMPLVGSVDDTLDLYFQVRATFTSCEQLACMASTLANNGTCSTTKTMVVSPSVVTKTIGIMDTCKISGAASLKLTGTGGESGALFVVVPGVAGFAVYSPLLNNKGVSARGIRLCNEIANEFKL